MNHDLEDNTLQTMEQTDSTINNLTNPAIKKDQILERLNKRNKERQNYLDVKLEQRHKDSSELEGADYFKQTFADKVREIELRIKNVTEATAKKSAGDGPTIDLARYFADITIEIQELQKYLTNSTTFLTEYKIKSCQKIVNDLLATCEETRIRLMPKKKFGFSGRKVTPKPALNPKLSLNDKLDSSEKLQTTASSQNVVNWTLSNLKNEYICLKEEQVNGKDITISSLKNCFVELQGPAGSVQISNCQDCTFLCGPIARSLFAEYCNNCALNVACQQLRFHSSAKCRIYLHVTCRGIIEDCKEIEIAPYNYEYAHIEEDFKLAGLNKEQNNYTDVADFNWLSPDVPSPNWHLIKDCPSVNWQDVRNEWKIRYIDNASL
ncbi:tubulin-specific chaperone C [Lucilia sericata]|uniref:tubulin-specific chaperone C n=1 Tax=Lucilia sericata TaxID=13632 RepID=UPI0018A86FF9|nr:tubulin-specific chaperone C [Lucilia sericata]XP_037817187.1 tubulin-specific chaperone C [Lucilia sericata]XP_037817194.1 tubulin-specific chaperone C [Lucilia sericata]XP_037817201.1 tubulin-specific chaperone C [Lucilia sericata]